MEASARLRCPTAHQISSPQHGLQKTLLFFVAVPHHHAPAPLSLVSLQANPKVWSTEVDQGWEPTPPGSEVTEEHCHFRVPGKPRKKVGNANACSETDGCEWNEVLKHCSKVADNSVLKYFHNQKPYYRDTPADCEDCEKGYWRGQ